MRGFARWWWLAGLLVANPGLHAARLRVVAAAELQIAPRISPGGAVTLALRARDDHGTAVRGHVRVEVFVRARPVISLDGETDANGEAVFEVPLPPDEREFHAVAELVGSTSTASARQEADIDLALPFVTVDLHVPSIVDASASELEADVTVHVGEIVPANPSGWPVALYLDDRSAPMVAEVDDTGFHAFHVPMERLGGPGVVTLHAAYARHGASEVRTIDRRVVLRAATRMTLARLDGSNSRLVGTLDTANGPVVGESVQVVWRARTVAAALTDARGNFLVDVDPDVIGLPGVVLEARFDPGEPWFIGSRSAPLVLTPPEARRISWRWALIPVGIGLAVLAIGQWIRRRVSPPTGRMSIPAPALGDVTIERFAGSRSSRVRIDLLVEDRATLLSVPGARAVWTVPPLGEKPANESVTVPGSARFECVVRADGYAPRTVASDLPRGGDYQVRVPLRTWREELFERARAWMRRAGAMGAPSLPTPREVLNQRSADPRAEELVGLIEDGTYGPAPPDAETVASADALTRELDARPQRER